MPVINEKTRNITGATLLHKNIMKKSSNSIPHFSKKFSRSRNLAGRSEKSILDPSSGGIGIKLNTASTRLVMTIILVIL